MCGLFLSACGIDTQRDLFATKVAKFQNSHVTDKAAVLFFEARTTLDCMAYCTRNVSCQSVFATEKAGLCQLNPLMYFEDADWRKSPGTAYYEMTDGKNTICF